VEQIPLIMLCQNMLAPMGHCDDLMKPTKWRSSRP